MTASYVKMPKGVQDYAPGFQTFNQFRDNLEAQRALWGLEHGLDTNRAPFNTVGRHNAPFIPRAVFDVTSTTVRPGLTVTQISLIGTNFGFVGNRADSLGAGQYFVAVGGLQVFFAMAAAKSAGAATRFVSCTSFYATVAGQQTGVFINAYELNTGDFVPTDYPVSVALYGY